MAAGSKLPATLRGACGKVLQGRFTVARLLPDAKAVVSVKGLCRLVERPSGKVFAEFVTRRFAHQQVALQVFCQEGEWIEAVDYETGKVLNFDNRGLSDDPRERSYQVHHFSSGLHADENTVKVRRKVYHRAQGFKLGRLLPGPAKRFETVKLFKPKSEDKRPFRSAQKQHAS
ncbi:hypothetical protein [Lacipirellula parvula]|uniref:Uncharacterized protein n=1 Tax=Lacipirellula parvula TaxID=2650471 RepID=A0A5K7XDN4_9BACT|nr:hypothetical protein [Lacipirellula parvula]BBO34588.1 hypothetical protein PLANPX_4200 [Lacipirellula parvula]